MSRRLLAATLLVLSPPLCAQESEQPPERRYRLFGTTNTYAELNQREGLTTDEDEYWKLKEIFTFNIAWSKLTAGAQVEYLYYSDEGLVDPLDLDRLRDTWELRKYYLDYATDRFSGRLGTFYTSFGHGLTLYVQKNDVLGLDEPVHGATLTATLKGFDITLLGGNVTEPLLENQYGRRFEDTIWGGRVLAHLPHDGYVGTSFVGAELDTFLSVDDSDDVEVWSVEGGVANLVGHFDLHGEWVDLERTESGRVKDGHGGYVSVTSIFGPVTVLGEYKDYLNFEYRYNQPPNAGRSIEAYEHRDAKGGRLLVQGDIAATGTLLYASYGDFDTHKKETSPGGTGGDRQVEWYVGVEETAGPVYFEGSYFDRDRVDREIVETHIIGDLHVMVSDRHEAIVGYDKRLEKASYFRLATHRSYAALSWAPWGTLSVRHAWEEKTNSDTEYFWAGELEVNPTHSITFSVFVGGDPGGLVCSGGQCREEPRFEGYKARFTWRF